MKINLERIRENKRRREGNLIDVHDWRQTGAFTMKGNQLKQSSYYVNFSEIKKPCGCVLGTKCKCKGEKR